MSDRFIPVKTRLLNRTHHISDCWVWMGTKVLCKDGHYRGKINYERKQHYVHRLAYKLYVGPLSRGQYLRHTCGNTLCWYPGHLKLI